MGQIVKMSAEDAGKLWYKLSTYESSLYGTWRSECLENRAFYFGNQATDTEISDIEDRGQYYIVINKIRKAMRTMAGMLTASVPKYKVIPVGSDDNLKAALGNRLLDWVWNNSGGSTMFRRVVKDSMIDNIKYIHVVMSKKENRVKLIPLSFDDVIVDPSSRHPMFSDAEMICIRRYVPIEYVKQVYGVADVVYEVPSTFYDYTSTTTPSATEIASSFIQKVYSSDKLYVNLYECYHKEYSPGDTPDEPGSIRIIKDTVIGFRHSYREELPPQITDYPIIPVYVEDTENPYKRGEIHFIKDLQRFINKTYGVVLLNAQLMSNPKVFLRETDIPSADTDEFEDNYSKPGSINILSGNAEAPIIVQGQPLNSAFFTLYQDAKMELEAQTVPAMLQSMATGENPNLSYLLDQKDIVLDSLKDFISIIDLASTQTGRVALQYCSAYLTPDKLTRLLDTSKATERMAEYSRMGLDVDNEESVRNYISIAEKNNIPSEVIAKNLAQAKADNDFMQALTYFTNMPSFSDMDIVVIPGSYTPTYEMAMMRLMVELSRSGAVDPSVILRYAPVENREELIERFDSLIRLTNQNKTLEEENGELKTALKQLEKQVVSERVNTQTVVATSKLDKMKAEAKVKELMRKYEHRLLTRELNNEFKEALVELLMQTKASELDERQKSIDMAQEEVLIL